MSTVEDVSRKRTSYGISQHRQQFAIWAAARAAQRGLKGGTVGVLADALTRSGVIEFAGAPELREINESEFNERHSGWCCSIVKNLDARGVTGATFGHAAKLVAVYLKVAVVLGPHSDCPLARVAHPPIDRRVLQNASRAPDIIDPRKGSWSEISWTDLNQQGYYELIGQLRAAVRDGDPFWTLERFWTAADQ